MKKINVSRERERFNEIDNSSMAKWEDCNRKKNKISLLVAITFSNKHHYLKTD